MEDSKTSISRILCLIILLASFDVSLAETQLPVRDYIEQKSSAFSPDSTASFNDDNTVIPPSVEVPEAVFESTTERHYQSHSAPFQRFRHIPIRAPPFHHSFLSKAQIL